MLSENLTITLREGLETPQCARLLRLIDERQILQKGSHRDSG